MVVFLLTIIVLILLASIAIIRILLKENLELIDVIRILSRGNPIPNQDVANISHVKRQDPRPESNTPMAIFSQPRPVIITEDESYGVAKEIDIPDDLIEKIGKPHFSDDEPT